jgi:predicted dehydrogenase
VEQHVHNLDIMNWALGTAPVSCTAMGGRALDLPLGKMGDRYDHFSSDFIYPNDVRVMSLTRQFPGTNGSIFERFTGTKGTLVLTERGAKITGDTPWESPESFNPYIQEHKDLIACVRAGTHVNETETVTTSTLTALLARTSAYTGRAINYSWLLNKSALNLTPEKWEFARKEITPPPVPGKSEPV